LENILNFKGKSVVITGALGGIGSNLIEAFSSSGATVFSLDIAKPSKELRNLLRATSARVEFVNIDVSNQSQVDKFFAEYKEELVNMTALINNVGIAGPKGDIANIDLKYLPELFATNVFSFFYTCQKSVPLLRKSSNASIVNVSSAAGVLGYRNRSAYAASKWAISGLTKSLAIELGPDRIRVNAVAPGAVQGDAIETAIELTARAKGQSPEETREDLLSQSVMHDFVKPSDVTSQILFLCSEYSERITGQIISVDAGTTYLI